MSNRHQVCKPPLLLLYWSLCGFLQILSVLRNTTRNSLAVQQLGLRALTAMKCTQWNDGVVTDSHPLPRFNHPKLHRSLNTFLSSCPHDHHPHLHRPYYHGPGIVLQHFNTRDFVWYSQAPRGAKPRGRAPLSSLSLDSAPSSRLPESMGACVW